MFHDIRNRILRRAYDQCLKLLGPNTDQVPTNTNYLNQWNTVFADPNGNPVPYEITNLDSLPPHYPLTKQDIQILGNVTSDGLNARRIQYVQMGSKNWVSCKEQNIIPCIFIENANDSFSITDPVEFNTQIGEIMPINIRLVMVQPPDSELSYNNSNPVTIARMRAALDYVLDPFWFKGLSETRKTRRGYTTPSQVFSADIVEAQNLEGQISPFEVVDYRLEVTFSRDRQLSGDPNNTL